MPKSKSSRRGKAARAAPPPPPTDPDSESDAETTGKTVTQCDSPTKAKRCKLVRSDLTIEEEEAMVEWLRENPQIYNKKLASYKDKGKKDFLWAEQARVLDRDVSLLTVWYRSIRTRYGKLSKLKSGAGAGERTERDLWILDKIIFLKTHIHEVQQRVLVSLKAKLAAQTQADDDTQSVGTDDVQQRQGTTVSTSTPENSNEPVVLEVRPKRSSSRSTAEEDRLLSALDERGRKSIQLQETLLGMVKPVAPPSERSTFGEWAKTVMEDLDQSLWRQFQQEQSQLLYKYLDLNDRVRSQPTQVSSQPQQQLWQPPQPQQQQWQTDQPQTSSSSQFSVSSQWQPTPENWPTTVETTSVWNSMSSTWVQAQMHNEPSLTTLPSCVPSTPQNPVTLAGGPTTHSPLNEDESPLTAWRLQ